LAIGWLSGFCCTKLDVAITLNQVNFQGANHMSQNYKLRTLALSVSLTLATTPAFAAEDNQAGADDKKLIILGSRIAPRSVSDSPVPIDLISGDDFAQSPAGNLLDTMSNLVPSFNVNIQPISDGATMVRPANMRGLPPDNTLVLVNGKRRHRAAVITFLGAGLSDGSQGPDISVIPSLALQQVEILRDGAAAQYGSDAIAGVMNFVLKDDNSGGVVKARLGQYKQGDGDSILVTGNFGVPLSDQGFANITYQFKESDATSRSVQSFEAEALAAAGLPVANPAQIWGSPEITDDISIFGNFGLDLGNDAEAYLFANYSKRHVEGGFFFRNPLTRNSIYQGERFLNGEWVGLPPRGPDRDAWLQLPATILVGDMQGGNTAQRCYDLLPGNGRVNIVNNVPDQVALDILQANNCWAFNMMFPGGFTPRFGGDVIDSALTAGMKGYFKNGIGYDFSATVGRSETEFNIFNTVNPSMGSNSPNDFNAGAYIELDKSANADFTQEVQLDGREYPLQLAYGYEYKNDSFEIVAGDSASYELGPLHQQGFSFASNGFGGFQPVIAGVSSRHNHALYFDIEAQVSETVLIGGAIRTEDYSDFGSTLDGKLTALIFFNDEVSFRASTSTGFRAPTVGQSNVRKLDSAFSDGLILDQATLPPTHPASIYVGGSALQPEESTAISFGFVAEMDELFVTIDFFQIKVTDRIGTSRQFVLSDEDIRILDEQGVENVQSLQTLRFFTNAFDTTTEGIDLVANYSLDHWGGTTALALVSSYVKTEVTRADPNTVDAKRIFQLESTLPKYRSSFTVNHQQQDWTLTARLNYYGAYSETHLDILDLLIDVGAEVTLDASLAFEINSEFTISVGAQNILDEYPQENTDFGQFVGAKYSVTSPMGFNGAYYYAELTYHY
jgi:iron complex outermembrane recepter protein